MPSKYLKLENGVNIHYVEEGEGPLVLFLHGFPEFWWSWRFQTPVLSKQFRVVTPDMRGYNLSDKPKGVKQYTIPILIEDIKKLIIGLGEKEAYIVGHDWGGIVSWAFASEYPEMVRKVVIINMPHLDVIARSFMHFNWRQIMRSYYVFLFQVPVLPEKVITSSDFFEKLMEMANMVYKENIVDDAKIYREAYSHPGAATATVNYYRAAFRDFVTGRLYKFKPIQSPMMMLWGAKDHALGKELTFNTDQYCVGHFEIHYDDTSGHNPHQDNPAWVNEHLLRFFVHLDG